MKRIIRCAAAFFLALELMPAADWRPIDPSELAQKTPKVEPGADAEAIFWDIKLEDRLQGEEFSLAMNHYIRIKIYTDLGREQYATVEIPRTGKRIISDVAARTIKPDGTIIDLKKDSIFDRKLVKFKGLNLQGKTFTLPNVAAGDIIEYRYREVHIDEISSHMRLYFQRELPMWSVSYHLKPLNLPWQPYAMRTMSFQCKNSPFEKEPDGFYVTSMKDVPAFKEEPYMPPEDNLRAWLLIYYEEDKKIDVDKFWKETGKADFALFKPLSNADGQVKRTAAELVSGSDKDEQKLAAIERFCRTKIRNVLSSSVHLTPEERKAYKENHSPADTLKHKEGTGTDINLLFVALANAAGFDARMARIADRGDFFFHKGRTTTYFLNARSVAVNSSGKWLFFDPATSYLEPGMLRWQEEGTQALVSDPKEGFFVTTQYTDQTRSKRVRRGNFKLLGDGTLEGTVQYSYTGHAARGQKSRLEGMTPAQQEDDWKDSLKERLSNAEISAFEIKDVTDPSKPVSVKYEVRIPGYATRTGKRLLLQPAFFQRNQAPRFTESQRKFDLYFDYAWSEDDEVTIELPDGWQLDAPVSPASSPLGEVGNYKVEAGITADGKKLVYKRWFDWGRQNKLLINVAAYPNVKKVFDFVEEQDSHAMAFRTAGDAK